MEIDYIGHRCFGEFILGSKAFMTPDGFIKGWLKLSVGGAIEYGVGTVFSSGRASRKDGLGERSDPLFGPWISGVSRPETFRYRSIRRFEAELRSSVLEASRFLLLRS